MKINLTEGFASFDDHWSPRIAADLNGQQVKLAKFQGTFDWHSHAEEDEMLLVHRGSFVMEFRDRRVELREGEFIEESGHAAVQNAVALRHACWARAQAR